MANWIISPHKTEIGNQGLGGRPGAQRFYKIPGPQGWQDTHAWITSEVADRIRRFQKTLRLEPVLLNQRIGNLKGEFDRSKIHGQVWPNGSKDPDKRTGNTIWGFPNSEDSQRLREERGKEDNREREQALPEAYLPVIDAKGEELTGKYKSRPGRGPLVFK